METRMLHRRNFTVEIVRGTHTRAFSRVRRRWIKRVLYTHSAVNEIEEMLANVKADRRANEDVKP